MMATKKMKPIGEDVLRDWATINDYLRDASEDEALLLLEQERSGKRRLQIMLRAHSRFNKQRAQRERSELLTGVPTGVIRHKA